MFSAQVVQLGMWVPCRDVSKRQLGSLGTDKSAGLQTCCRDILRHNFQQQTFNTTAADAQ